VGSVDGSLALFDLQQSSCPILARAPAITSPLKLPVVTQLVAEPSVSFVFAVRGGDVLTTPYSLLQLQGDDTSCAPELELSRPLDVGEGVSCIATAWSRQQGLRLCCASQGTYLYVFGFSLPAVGPESGAQLLLRVPLQLPAGFGALVSLAWGKDERVLLSDGQQFVLVPWLPDCLTGITGTTSRAAGIDRATSCTTEPVAASPFVVAPLQARNGNSFGSGGGRAVGMALPTGELLAIGARHGGGYAAVCVEASECELCQESTLGNRIIGTELELPVVGIVGDLGGSAAQHISGPISRPTVLLEGSGMPVGVAIAWPYLLACSQAHVRVYDLQSGTLVQATSLPHATTRAAGSESEAGGSTPLVHAAACGAHHVVMAIGRSLFVLPPSTNGTIHREVAWLNQLLIRPWDATLVEQHMARVLNCAAAPSRGVSSPTSSEAVDVSDTPSSPIQGDHPLARAITRLVDRFAYDARRIATLNGTHSSPTVEGCATACGVARNAVMRISHEALMMYPQLAPRSADEVAHGAGGAEMLKILQTAAYGALRPTLIALQLELAPETARRHQLQLRLLSRLMPEHLGLPSAFCARPHPGDASQPSTRPPPMPYAEAVQRLRQLPQAGTPERGLQCLIDVCRRVADAAEAIGAPPPAADDLVPLITYVCVASQLASLPTELSLLQDLASDAQLNGEQGYCLATFQVALRWLLTLKWDRLHFEAAQQPIAAAGAAATSSSNGCRRAPPSRRPAGVSALRQRGGVAVRSMHPSIVDSIELLRALEAELPNGLGSPQTPGPGVLPRTQVQATGDPLDADSTRLRELRDLGVRDLLAEARRLTVDCSTCVEKRDLFELLLEHSGSAVKTRPDNGAGSGSKTGVDSVADGAAAAGIADAAGAGFPLPVRAVPERACTFATAKGERPTPSTYPSPLVSVPEAAVPEADPDALGTEAETERSKRIPSTVGTTHEGTSTIGPAPGLDGPRQQNGGHRFISRAEAEANIMGTSARAAAPKRLPRMGARPKRGIV
jgi:hypothetical protein